MAVALSVAARARVLLTRERLPPLAGSSAAARRVGEGRGRSAARIREVERLLARDRRYVRRRTVTAEWRRAVSTTMPGTLRAEEKVMRIDSNAATGLTHYTGDPAETDFLRYDISNLAHNALDDADVLVIGVGGGRDVLSALEFGQRSVTGVEINPNILKITNGVYGDFTGHLDRDPRVTFVADEARSYLDTVEEPLRPHPDVAHRHVGGVLGRRVRAERELAVHDPGVGHLPRPAHAERVALRVALVLDSRTGAATRGVPRGRRSPPRCSATAAPPIRARTCWRTPAPPNGQGATAVTLLVSPEPFTDEALARLTARCRAAPLQAGAHARRGRRRALRRLSPPPTGPWPPRSTSTPTSRRPPTTGRSSSRWPTSGRS